MQVPTLHSATTQAAPGQSVALAPAAPPGAGAGKAASTAGAVTERAAGLNLSSPAGRYSLDLSHPAAKHIIHELLDLKSRLAAFQQEQEAEAAAAAAAWDAAAAEAQRGAAAVAAQVCAAAADAEALAALSDWPARRRSTMHDYINAIARRASRSEAPQAPKEAAATAAAGGEAAGRYHDARASIGSCRHTVGEDSKGTGRAGAAGGRALVARFRAPPVDALSITDIQLDGARPIKLDKLLDISPWLSARGPAAAAAQGRTGAEAVHKGGSGAGPASPAAATTASKESPKQQGQQAGASAGGAGSGGAVGKKAKVHRRLTFVVRVAAVPSAEEPAMLPAHLLRWAVKVGGVGWGGVGWGGVGWGGVGSSWAQHLGQASSALWWCACSANFFMRAHSRQPSAPWCPT
jgi:hypothetical protein